MEDLISVIVNVYNDEKYLKDCILSIISQTYRNMEIIIWMMVLLIPLLEFVMNY